MMKNLVFIIVSFGVVALLNAQSFTPETNIVSGVIRDFWPCKNLANCGKYGVNIECDPTACLPDVEMDSGSYTPGLILNYLDSSRKPIFNNATTSKANINNATTFYYWFHNSEKFSKQFVANIPMSNTVCNTQPCNGYTYGYVNNSYFPLNNQGFGNYGPGFPNQNFHFCLELHLRFTYRGVEFYSFTGDDDLWVFIDNKLVIDLGGIHVAMTRSIQLNTTAVLKDLVIGQTYPFDMFYCERHTSASNLALYTDLALDCPYYDWCGVCQGNGQECCECNDNNVCTNDLCDVYTGNCIYKMTSPPGDTSNQCYPWTCDPVTGWSQSALLCNDNDACTTDSCVNATGCAYQTKNCDDGNSCTEDSCNVTSGCQYKQLPNDPCSNAACVNGQNPAVTHVCNTTNYCMPQVCISNECVTAYVLTCDDKNPCTIDVCNNGTCINTPKNCSDNSVCTIDSCKNGTCVNEQISCDDGNLCTEDLCDPVGGCHYTNVTFEAVANCMTSYCDPVVGVVTTPIVCLPKSSCSCQNNACVCKPSFLQSTGAKIGAGVIAAIVVGIVVAVVIFAVVGKKGYDYYQTAHAATTPLGTNPMYVDKENKGNNPFYTDETA